MTLSRADLFVANEIGNSVTDFNAATGALVRVISGSPYQFEDPGSTALSGDDLFVENSGSLTELNAATGALVRVISGQYSSDGP